MIVCVLPPAPDKGLGGGHIHNPTTCIRPKSRLGTKNSSPQPDQDDIKIRRVFANYYS